MRYSVIIATYNRALLLRKCLDALSRQTANKSDYEIIVINDGSSDGTEEILKQFTKIHPELNFSFITQKNRGVAAARNAGIRRAKGEIIFFTDDDCVPPPEWIETLADSYLRYPEVAGVGGWFIYPQEWHKNHIFVRYTTKTISAIFADTLDKETKITSFLNNPAGNTSNMSYRKKILDELGGFDETMDFTGLVDWELKKRVIDLGFPLLYIPYHVLHLKPLGAKEVIRKFFNKGRGAYHISKKYPDIGAYYYPQLARHHFMVKTFGRSMPMKCMAVTDFFFKSLGWEYQKFLEG